MNPMLLRDLRLQVANTPRGVAARIEAQDLKELIEERDELLAALDPFTDEHVDLTDARCHVGITTADKCRRCSKTIAARNATRKASRGR